jgi:hypothetical protein
MNQQRYLSETSPLYRVFPDVSLGILSAAVFLARAIPIRLPVPDQPFFLFWGAALSAYLLIWYAGMCKHESVTIDILNWSMVIFGVSAMIGIYFLLNPMLGQTAPYVFLTAAVHTLVMMKSVRAGTFPILQFLWSVTVAILATRGYSSWTLAYGMYFPLGFTEDLLRKLMPKHWDRFGILVVTSVFPLFLLIVRLIEGY